MANSGNGSHVRLDLGTLGAYRGVDQAIGPHGLSGTGSSLYVVDGDSLYRLSAPPPDPSRLSRSLRGVQMSDVHLGR